MQGIPHIVGTLIYNFLNSVSYIQILIFNKRYPKDTENYFVLNPLQLILGEIVGTFALIMVILFVVRLKSYRAFLFYGLWIGGTVAVFAFLVGSFSGGAFNPAVAIAFLLSGYYTPLETLLAITSQLSAAFVAYQLSELFDNSKLNSKS